MNDERPECCEQCDQEDVDLYSLYGSWLCDECCAEDDADIAALME